MKRMEDCPGIDAGNAIDERDLMAFADGRLDTDCPRAAELRAHLAAHPDVAARLAVWQRQNEAIRGHYAPALAESLPPRLQPHALRGEQARRRRARGRWIAATSMGAVALAVALGISFGPDGRADPELDRFAADVAQLSAGTLPDAEQATGADAGKLPSLDLAGFALTERRTIRAGEQTATEARYEDQRGQTVRLFVAKESETGRPEMRRLERDGRELVYWREGGRMFALSTESVDSARLQQIATATMRNDLQRSEPPDAALAGVPDVLPDALPEVPQGPAGTVEAKRVPGWNSAPGKQAPARVLNEATPDESL